MFLLQSQMERLQSQLKRANSETAANQAQIAKLTVAAKADGKALRDHERRIHELESQHETDLTTLTSKESAKRDLESLVKTLQSNLKEMIVDHKGSQEELVALNAQLGQQDDQVKSILDRSMTKSAEQEP